MKYLHIWLVDEEAPRTYTLREGSQWLFGSFGAFVDLRVGALVHNGFVNQAGAGALAYFALWVDDRPEALPIPDNVNRAQEFDFEFPARSAKVFRWGRAVARPIMVRQHVEQHSIWTVKSVDRATRIRVARENGAADPSVGLYYPRAGDRQPLGLKIGNAQGGQGRNPFPGWEGSLELYIQVFDAFIERFFGMAVAVDGLRLSWEDVGQPNVDYVQGGGPMQKHVQLPNLYVALDPWNQRVAPKYTNKPRTPGRDPIWEWEDFDDQHLVEFEAALFAAGFFANDPLATYAHKCLVGAIDITWTPDEIETAMPNGHRGTGCYGRALGWMALAHARPVMFGDTPATNAYTKGTARAQTRGGFWEVWPAVVAGLAPDPWRSPGFKISRSKMVSQSIEQGIMLVAAHQLGLSRNFKRGLAAWLFNPALRKGPPPKFIITGKDGDALDEVTEGVGYGSYIDTFTPWWALGLALEGVMHDKRRAAPILRKMLEIPPPGAGTLARDLDELLDMLIGNANTEHTNVAVGALEDSKGTAWVSGRLL